MAAANTDYFTEVGSPGTATTLAAPGHTTGGSTFNVISTSNWPTTTGVVFAVDTFTLQTVNGVPNTAVRTPGSYTEWEGVVSSSTSITSATIRYGTDQNYTAGTNTRVYIPVASSRENRLVQGISSFANQDATLKQAAIISGIGTGGIATTSIADGAVTAAKLATSAITLGYAQSTTSFTTTSTTAVQVTGLTAAVTIPAGGRRVKITAFGSDMFTNTSTSTSNITIWDGTVGSGTQLARGQGNGAVGTAMPALAIAVVTPAAGAKTYNVGFHVAAGSGTIEAAASYPMFILVEVI